MLKMTSGSSHHRCCLSIQGAHTASIPELRELLTIVNAGISVILTVLLFSVCMFLTLQIPI